MSPALPRTSQGGETGDEGKRGRLSQETSLSALTDHNEDNKVKLCGPPVNGCCEYAQNIATQSGVENGLPPVGHSAAEQTCSSEPPKGKGEKISLKCERNFLHSHV